jgi:hypothetical protein
LSSAADAPPTGGAAALDRLAEQLLEAAPWRVAIAVSETERTEIHLLREEQVVSAGWASPREHGDGRGERDEHDDRALHIAAWDGTALVGAIRLVFPRPGRRLPTEQSFDIEVEPRGHVVEVGRLVIAPRYRGDPAHRAWGALFGRAWTEIRHRGFAIMAGTANARLVALYRRQGLAFEVLGPARTLWGEPRHPVRLDPEAGQPARWFGRSGG